MKIIYRDLSAKWDSLCEVKRVNFISFEANFTKVSTASLDNCIFQLFFAPHLMIGEQWLFMSNNYIWCCDIDKFSI